MMRFLFWLLLLASMVFAAVLVRDGQTTLFGAPSPLLKAFLEHLPLPAPPPPVVVAPPQPPPDPRLVGRLAMVESIVAQHQEALEQVRKEQEREFATLLQTAGSLGQHLAVPPQSRLVADGGRLQVRGDDSGWRLEDYFAKRRIWSQRVVFTAPFAAPPRVMLGVTRIETGPEGSIEVQPTDVDGKGFTMLINAEEGRPREVKVQWLALGEISPTPSPTPSPSP